MAKSNIYTRGGDAGETSLASGERISKTDVRLEAYGTIDELSSVLGAVIPAGKCPEEIKGQLLDIQNRLFDLGGYLACRPKGESEPTLSGIQEDVEKLEGWIDALDEQTPRIKAFVLPGGTLQSSLTHMARTVCRRAERRIYALSSVEYVDPAVRRYVNRLSDYLFILARYFNFLQGEAEVVWRPRK